MLRILLASGEEAVYRTVEELAMGISSGTITAAARVFDARTQDWQSIDSHPEYHEALARAAILAATMEPDPEPVSPVLPAPPIGERNSGPFQIYQMFSRSAAELQAKRRPARLLPAFTIVAGVVMVASMMVVMRREPSGPVHRDEPTSPADATEPTSTSRSASSVVSVQAMRLAPVNLAGHRAAMAEAAARDLTDSAEHLGMRDVLGARRLAVLDSVRLGRARLSSLRALIEEYRGALRHSDQVYRDSAAGLVKTGFWSRIDEQEWRLRIKPLEPGRDAARADSLLQALERVFDLLVDKAGRYQTLGARVQFEEQGAEEEYDRLRASLARYGMLRDSVSPGSGPLGVLVQAAYGAPPSQPQRLPVSP